MDDDQQFCLRWNNHQSTLISVFDTLLEKGIHVDCTLAAEGQTLKAHKVVLSACSPYFESVLSQQYDKHPIIILKDVKFAELRAMMDYMYRGEVNISQDQLAALLKAAESLQIKGLSDSKPPPRTSSPVHKARVLDSSADSRIHSREGSSSPLHRKRKKPRRNSTNDTNDSEALSNSIAPPENIPAHNHTGAAPAVVPPPKPPPPPPEILNDTEAVAAKSKAEVNDAPNIKCDLPIEAVTLKGEVCEEGTEDSVEDLTLDEEVDSEGEQTGAGPSHPQGDCVQSFAWHMDRSQDEGIPMDGQRDTQAVKSTVEEKILPTKVEDEKKLPIEEIKKSVKEPNSTIDVDIIAEVFARTTPLTRAILRGTKYKPPLQKVTRKRKSALKKNTILKLQAKVLKKGSEDCPLPSALLSLLTARRLQSGMNALPSVLARRAHEASVKSINLFPPDVVRNFSDNIEKARLIQQSILQMSQRGGPETDSAKCEDGESDYEDYDDTDDILLPDESEVFYGSKAFSVREDQNSPYLFVDIKPDVHNSSSDSGHSPRSIDDGVRMFECRHCGKKYRWKSTLRRHENVECGGKAPSHQCPYCAYKAKQRGNLGVHIRKHHVKEWSIYASNKIRKSKKDAS